MADVLEVLILAEDRASKVFNGVGSALGSAFKIGTGIAIGGLTAFTAALGLSISEAMDAEAIQAELAAVLKSTGGIAGMTANEVNTLSDKLSKVTKFSDDTITSAQSMLLTFTQIGENIFPQATEATLNLAEKFGSVDQAAIQLGKALNDPIAGVTALRRVGVSLTEQQEDQIKAFMEVGDIASAQAIILKELETEFGGLARAAGNTLGGKLTILKNRFLDVFESVGMKLLPALNKLADHVMDKIMPVFDALVPIVDSLLWPITRFIENLASGMSIGDAFNKLFGDIAVTLQWFLDQLGIGSGTLSDIVASLIWPFQRFFEAASNGTPLLENLAGLLVDFNDVFEYFLVKLGVSPEFADKLTDAIRPLLQQFDSFVSSIISFVKEHAEGFKAAFLAIAAVIAGHAFIGGLVALGAAIAALFGPVTLIALAVGALAFAWKEDWGGIRTFFMDNVWPVLKYAFQELKAWLEVNLPKAVIFLRDFWEQKLLPALLKLQTFWYETLKPALLNLVEWFMTNIPNAINNLKVFWDTVLMPLLTGLKAYWDEHLEPFFSALVNYLGTKIGEAINILAPIVNTVLVTAFDAAKIAATALWTILGLLASKLQNAVKDAVEAVMPYVQGFTELLDGATAALNKLTGSGEFKSGVENLYNSIPQANTVVYGGGGTGTFRTRDQGGTGFPGQLYKIGVPEFFMPGTPGTFMPLENFQKGIMAAVSDFNVAIERLDSTIKKASDGANSGGGNPSQTVNHFNLNVASNSSDERVISDFNTMRVWAGA